MARLTILFGVLLAALGIGSYVATGSAHPTSLIPLWFGLALILSGALASTQNTKQRMLWMHIAVTLALIGSVFPGFMAAKDLAKAHAASIGVAHPAAVYEQLAMALLCLIFFLTCVWSFNAARRSRTV